MVNLPTPLTQMPKRGDTVICIAETLVGKFTKGKEYTAGGRYYNEFGVLGVVTCDDGKADGWALSNFGTAGGPW